MPASFCHSCSRSVELIQDADGEPLCPRCRQGFVEETPEDAAGPAGPVAFRSLFDMLNGGPLDADDDDDGGIFALAEGGRAYGAVEVNVQQAGAGAGGAQRNLANFLGAAFQAPNEQHNGGAAPDGYAGLLNGLFAALASPNVLAFGPIAGGRLGDYASEGQLQNIISDLLQQAGGHTGPPPMSEEAIAALPRRNLTDKDIAAMTRSVCDVCKDDFESGADVIELPCTHVYDADCIRPWLREQPTCPSCRRRVDTDEAAEASDTAPRDRQAAGVEAEDVD